MDSIPSAQRLKEKIAAVEQQLERVVPAMIPEQWASENSGSAIRAIDPAVWQRIIIPARDLVSRGGKRWRPLFMLLCAEIHGDWHSALPLTPLVELAHNGSLIVDDIEDRAVQRRGAEAIHIKFGIDLALNAGNLMYFLPARTIDTGSFDPAQKLILHRYYAEEMIRLHFGQGLDILWHRDHENIPSEEQYTQMCRLKTGSLSRLAARAGVIAGGGSEQDAETLGRISEDFGACFQIIDDVKNLTTGVPGKQRGDDIIEGKKSLPIILFLQHHPEAKIKAREAFERAGGKDPDAARQAIDELIELISPSGCLEEAEQRARSLLQQTRASLEEAVPRSPAREEFQELVEQLISG